jgi:hypothetical protein
MAHSTLTLSKIAGSALLFSASIAIADAPPQLETTIESVGLFKNGLAVVRRSITLPVSEGNVFDITDLPEPVHGTFWVESAAELTITMTHADIAVEAPRSLPGMDNGSLAGSSVTVHFKSEHLPALRGVVAAPPTVAARQWDTNYGWSQPRHHWMWSGFSANGNTLYTPHNARQLVLETDAGEIVLDTESVAYLRVEQRGEAPRMRRPVLRVTVHDAPDTASIDVGILYLTKGASWAPSYEINLEDSSQLTLRQSAVIRNELEDWNDVELLLISGFPSIEFGHVLSPLSPATDLASFFRALGEQPGLSHSSRGDVMAQTVMYNDVHPAFDVDFASVEGPSLAGIDLHYHSIGRRSLKAGDSMLVQTANGEASGEMIVQWSVPDDRDEWGARKNNRYAYGTIATSESNELWDAVRFRNPLDRALTTAPALVVKDGRVRGQGMLYWSGPGEQVVLPINKTLSVRAWVDEVETEDAREEVRLYNRSYWRTTVNGTMTMVNQRAEPVKMVARLEFSGELIDANGEPVTSLRGLGVWSVNPRRQMTWTVELGPGETRELAYSYSVLAPR